MSEEPVDAEAGGNRLISHYGVAGLDLKRSEMRSVTDQLIVERADEIRAAFCKPDAVKSYVDGVLGNLNDGPPSLRRHSRTEYARVMKLYGQQTKLVIAIWERLGVSGEKEAERKLSRVREVEGMSPREMAERSLEAAVAYGNVDEAFRVLAIQRLGGLVAVPAAK